MSKTVSEYLVEGLYMTKAVLDGRATQLIDLAKANLFR
jgi:hypothetical protein